MSFVLWRNASLIPSLNCIHSVTVKSVLSCQLEPEWTIRVYSVSMLAASSPSVCARAGHSSFSYGDALVATGARTLNSIIKLLTTAHRVLWTDVPIITVLTKVDLFNLNAFSYGTFYCSLDRFPFSNEIKMHILLLTLNSCYLLHDLSSCLFQYSISNLTSSLN